MRPKRLSTAHTSVKSQMHLIRLSMYCSWAAQFIRNVEEK
jgi:hypothetical protein